MNPEATKSEFTTAVGHLLARALEDHRPEEPPEVGRWETKRLPQAIDVKILPGHRVQVGRFCLTVTIPRR